MFALADFRAKSELLFYLIHLKVLFQNA